MTIDTPPPPALHLSDIENGRTVRLLGVDHGHALRMRLTALGLTPGTVLRMVQRSHGGPCIVAARGMRVALGRGMVSRIRVESAS